MIYVRKNLESWGDFLLVFWLNVMESNQPGIAPLKSSRDWKMMMIHFLLGINLGLFSQLTPLWKGLLLGGTPRIPNHQPKPTINHSLRFGLFGSPGFFFNFLVKSLDRKKLGFCSTFFWTDALSQNFKSACILVGFTVLKTNMTLEHPHYSIGTASSFMVDFPASHVSFLESRCRDFCWNLPCLEHLGTS